MYITPPDVLEDFALAPSIAVAISAETNNLSPSNDTPPSLILLNVRSSTNLTGMIPSGGWVCRRMLNVGNSPLTLVSESASSDAANRFSFAADVVLPANASVELMYNPITTRWVQLSAVLGVIADTMEVYQDFINPAGDGWDEHLVGAGAATSQISGEALHPGIMRCATGTTTTGNAGRGYAPDAGTAFDPIVLGSAEITIDAVIRVPVLATDAENVFPRVGLMDEINSVPNNGLYITTVKNADPAVMVWGAVARAAGVSTGLTSTIPVVVNTWTSVRLVLNAAGTSAELFVEGVSAGTITTGFPTAGMTVAAQGAKSAGTTSRNVEFDLVRVSQSVNRF